MAPTGPVFKRPTSTLALHSEDQWVVDRVAGAAAVTQADAQCLHVSRNVGGLMTGAEIGLVSKEESGEEQ